MSLPTDLANDYTNPADEIPATEYAVEADPAFDSDPLTDATGIAAPTSTPSSGLSTGAIVGISVAAVAVIGGAVAFFMNKKVQ